MQEVDRKSRSGWLVKADDDEEMLQKAVMILIT